MAVASNDPGLPLRASLVEMPSTVAVRAAHGDLFGPCPALMHPASLFLWSQRQRLLLGGLPPQTLRSETVASHQGKQPCR